MSKFLPPESYAASGAYDLLPFNFTRLEGDSYLATNMVGEALVMERDVLDALINKQLSPASPVYADARAKHLIAEQGDKSPAELLALKTRTRYQRLGNFTNLHMFVTTLRCDHSCQYCQVSRQSEDKAAFDMTPEIADRSLDLVFRSPSKAVKIEFQGGEPLLNFDLIKYIVGKARPRAVAEGRDLQVVIATTLSLATTEILEYCRDNDILLSVSLDGPHDLHNKNRPRPGKDSHQRFIAGLQAAREIVGFDRVSALMTTTQASLSRVTDIIDEYVALGFNGIFLRALSPYGFAVKTKSYAAYDTEEWLKFYKDGLKYIIELNRSGIHFIEHYTTLVLQKMFTATDPGFVDLTNPAGIGIAAVVFNYDGSVYASDESRMLAEMKDQTFRLGSVLENTYEELFLNETLLSTLEESFTLSAPMCSECAFEPFCGTDPVFSHAVYGDVLGRKPSSDFCKRNMAIFRHLIQLMQQDKDIERMFRGWVASC
jgi:His-Xaa-Ser system radical SAM maturase HxsB